jgi:site-specific DNA-methyltransferase (adenine-specific)
VTEKTPFSLVGRNPDVLTCIANLSNDEVFTPPDFANQMLDAVAEAWASANGGKDIWANSQVTFLDPATKSGVFLREITKRLVEGLASEIPELQERVDHILSKQVFGIGMTQLTALLARRSLYCSKFANGPHSIAGSLDTEDGNVWFERTEHAWIRDRCKFCNAAKTEYGRGRDLETHAYSFIHTDDIQAHLADLFGGVMKFDVIIGNPPYQMGAAPGAVGEDGRTGRLRDVPIYHRFVEQAKRLEPRFLCMVTPSRWMASGLGLSEFRASMLTDRRLRTLVDYPLASEVFPGVEIKGGVSYFLWDAEYDGDAEVTIVRGDERSTRTRQLDEFDVFVRDPRAVEILHKVLSAGEPSITTILSADKEFGWTSNFAGFHVAEQENDVPLFYNRQGTRLIGYINREDVLKSPHLIDTWKTMIPSAGSGGATLPDVVLGKPFVAPSPSVCTQTYLFFHVASRAQAESVRSYLTTRFLRFLVSLRKITQHASPSTYTWVPMQSWDRTWTDDELYAKYGLTPDEIAHIELMIRPMDLGDGAADA